MDDLLNLPVRHAYLKTTTGEDRLPVCSVEVPLPPASDAACARRILEASALRYGRERAWWTRSVKRSWKSSIPALGQPGAELSRTRRQQSWERPGTSHAVAPQARGAERGQGAGGA